VKKREEKEAWAAELVRQLDKEKKVSLCMLIYFSFCGAKNRVQLRIKLEEERRALASFVSKFDSLGLSALPSKLKPAKPTPGGASAAFAERQQSRAANVAPAIIEDAECSPVRVDFSSMKAQPSLLDQMPEEEWCIMDDVSFEMESVRHKSGVTRSEGSDKNVLWSKENIPL
jgi:centromeric protein E